MDKEKISKIKDIHEELQQLNKHAMTIPKITKNVKHVYKSRTHKQI